MDLSRHLKNLRSKNQQVVAESMGEIERLFIAPAARRHALYGGDYDDAMQIGRIAMYNCARQYDVTMPAEPYIRTVLRNRLVTERKKARSTKRKPSLPIFRMQSHPDNLDLDPAAIIPAQQRHTTSAEIVDLVDQVWQLLPRYLSAIELDALHGKLRGHHVTSKKIDNALERVTFKLRPLAMGKTTVERLENIIKGIKSKKRLNWRGQRG